MLISCNIEDEVVHRTYFICDGHILYVIDFDIQFNPDVFVAGIKHADSPELLERDSKMAIDATCYLTESIIPKFVSQ